MVVSISSLFFFFFFLQSVSPSVGCMHSHWRSGCKHTSEHMEGVKKVSTVPVCDCRLDIHILLYPSGIRAPVHKRPNINLF